MPSDSNLAAFLHGRIDRQLALRRHGADRPPHAFAGADEQRQNEIGGVEPGFAHQAAHGFARPQAARAVNGKGHLNGF